MLAFTSKNRDSPRRYTEQIPTGDLHQFLGELTPRQRPVGLEEIAVQHAVLAGAVDQAVDDVQPQFRLRTVDHRHDRLQEPAEDAVRADGGLGPDPGDRGIGEAGEIGRYAYEKHAADDDFVQPRALYRDVMDDTDREHLASNIVGHASQDVSADVQRRVIAYWTNVDADLGARVAAGLGKGSGSGDRSAAVTPDREVAR